MAIPSSAARATFGVVLGAFLVPLDGAALVAAGPWRDRVLGAAVRVHERRLERWLDRPARAVGRPDRRARYLAVRLVVGLTSLGVVLLLAYGVLAAALMIASWAFDARVPALSNDEGEPTTGLTILSAAVPGVLLLYLAVMGLIGAAALERAAAARYLGTDDRAELVSRIESLVASRAGIVAAVEAERRRVERDLHDGAQQHVVALGMLVDRSRRATDDAARDALLAQAADETERLLTAVRDVAWSVHPTALDTQGLRPVLGRLAARAAPPARLDFRLAGRLAPTVEACAYYVVAEALTNVSKHARAARVDVVVEPAGGATEAVSVTVRDDGVGGAGTGTGRGLAGLAARVGALGGTVEVQSPTGGPTTVRAVLPCA
ncbi:histidine kinase [Isoptericola sp. 4D.3]|uniref:histidine kinase n=1 Tax=Isoptericola peretonis TaxID=2918523 RepID=A0ABT0J5Y5_9MICO|nr:histidine kinase [Isoptericola sp. 4D.3]